ncbi:hypothetical protein [Streptomyces sp. NPDC057557]|uniref:hypothetical protein n=1 Tax=Streptomyces sp. NPDC057557 TaxID=3346167 RepID=UPI0036CF216E
MRPSELPRAQEVARRAGHTPAVFWKFYAKILRGRQQASNRLIDDAPAEPGR